MKLATKDLLIGIAMIAAAIVIALLVGAVVLGCDEGGAAGDDAEDTDSDTDDQCADFECPADVCWELDGQAMFDDWDDGSAHMVDPYNGDPHCECDVTFYACPAHCEIDDDGQGACVN